MTRACLVAAAVLHLTAMASPASAQTSVEVSPLRVELAVVPGASHTQAITLTNTGKEPVRVRATVADWYLSKDGAPQFQEPEESRAYSASSWIRVAPPELVIPPGTDGTVRFSLAVPAGTAPAGYRTGILFDLAPDAASAPVKPRHVTVRSRIATLIYAHVGQPPIAVDLTDLRSSETPERTAAVATLKNTGRRSVRTKGTVRVLSAGGGVVYEGLVPDVPVLPESEREVAIALGEKRLPPGEYRIELKIDIGLSALIVGETTLRVVK